MSNVYIFLLKPFQQWKFKKPQITLLAKFFHKKTIVFQWNQFKFKFSLDFCFALFSSLKALTGSLEKLEISAEQFGLSNGLN